MALSGIKKSAPDRSAFLPYEYRLLAEVPTAILAAKPGSGLTGITVGGGIAVTVNRPVVVNRPGIVSVAIIVGIGIAVVTVACGCTERCAGNHASRNPGTEAAASAESATANSTAGEVWAGGMEASSCSTAATDAACERRGCRRKYGGKTNRS
jgi:hypothetical protein